jgi:glycosyltransferase involved in cell wall biosynthesis
MSIRLFVDAHVFDKGYEGTRTFIKGIYSEMSDYKDVELFLAAHNVESLKKEFPQKNIRFIKYKTSASFLRLMYEIPAIIRKYRIDWAHFQYVSPWVHNCKFIVTTHDLLFRERPQEFPWHYRLMRSYLFKRSAVKADILTTVSEYSKRSIQKHFDIENKEILVIKNGISSAFLKSSDKEFSRNYISKNHRISQYLLYVSRLEPRKNQAFLLKAFMELKLYEQNYRLVFVGRRSIQTKEFDELLLSLTASARQSVFILSNVDDEELFHFYNGAELFLYPSKAEGFGIPPLEAAVLKTDVLCSGTSAMMDFHFFPQQFDPFDYNSFLLKLRNCLSKKRSEADLCTVSDTIKENYCWKRSAQQLYDIIKSNDT